MGRNYLAGAHGDAANAVLAAAGYNFRRPSPGSPPLACLIMAILASARTLPSPRQTAPKAHRSPTPRRTSRHD